MEKEIFVEEEFVTDVDIDFSRYSHEEKLRLIKDIIDGELHTFENNNVFFSGDITVYINE